MSKHLLSVPLLYESWYTDLSFLLINELNSLRQTRNSSQETVASAESVLAISFAAEMRMVTYAYDNATRVAAISGKTFSFPIFVIML